MERILAYVNPPITRIITPGQRFGRGTVITEIKMASSSPNRAYRRGARLLCDCGTVYEVRMQELTKAKQPTRSCGCLARETAAATMSRPENIARLAAISASQKGKPNLARREHGLRHHPLYATWSEIKTRCYNPNVKQFKDWGGRGITLCDQWHDPATFVTDILRLIGPRPPGLTLDRIDNDGDYEPGNVRWATRIEQIRNSRRYQGGRREHALYQIWWRLMRQPRDEVPERWREFEVFTAEIEQLLGPRPAGLRFHRIDDSRSYEPGNVAWVTGAEQIKRAQAVRTAGPYDVKHGLYDHPLYKSWRLSAKWPERWHEPWLDVTVFISAVETELGAKPDGMQFRRIDPDGRYEPGNICWGKPGRPPRR